MSEIKLTKQHIRLNWDRAVVEKVKVLGVGDVDVVKAGRWIMVSQQSLFKHVKSETARKRFIRTDVNKSLKLTRAEARKYNKFVESFFAVRSSTLKLLTIDEAVKALTRMDLGAKGGLIILELIQYAKNNGFGEITVDSMPSIRSKKASKDEQIDTLKMSNHKWEVAVNENKALVQTLTSKVANLENKLESAGRDFGELQVELVKKDNEIADLKSKLYDREAEAEFKKYESTNKSWFNWFKREG